MLGVYIHWPYCLKKCPYCAFNSHLQEFVDQSRWQKAFDNELTHIAKHTQNASVASIFFGGGTPSLMPPQLISFIIEKVRQLWKTHTPLEVSLEANPMTFSYERFEAIKHAGVNRISLGVQSLHDPHLAFLGREHNRAIAIDAIKSASRIFQNLSFDLIYALPNQTLSQWQHTLSEAVFLKPKHLSLYQLTVEPNTPFAHQVARHQWSPPSQEQAAQMLRFTWDYLKNNGYNNYEISNFAPTQFECTHNKIYWEYEDFIGVGPGAHGRITKGNHKFSTTSFRAPQTWLDKALAPETALQSFTQLSHKESCYEYLSMSLRLKTGTSFARMQDLAQKPTHEVISLKDLQLLEAEHFLCQHPGGFHLTEKGRCVVDSICSKLLF